MLLSCKLLTVVTTPASWRQTAKVTLLSYHTRYAETSGGACKAWCSCNSNSMSSLLGGARCVVQLIGYLAAPLGHSSMICMLICLLQDACQSPLLRCLAQLDGDSWAQVLLPLLQQQGSAPAVALTCQTLRALCHSNVQNLDLSSLHDSNDTDQLEDALRSLPGHFSSCKTVQLLLEAEDSYHIMPYLLPSIARWTPVPITMQRGRGALGRGAALCTLPDCMPGLSWQSDAAATATMSLHTAPSRCLRGDALY